MPNAGRPTDLGALEQRVYGLEKAVGDISSMIAGLSSKIDERSRTSWPTLAAFASVLVLVMGALGALATKPMESSLNDIKSSLPLFVTRAEATVARTQIERELARLNMALEKADSAIVPRGEHQEKWRGNDQALGNIQRQVDEIRRDYGQTYSLRDAFAQMQRKVDDMEKELRAARSKPGT